MSGAGSDGRASLDDLGSPAEVFGLVCHRSAAAFLDSSDPAHPRSRFSIVAFVPSGSATTLRAIDGHGARRDATRIERSGIYSAGAIGFISYEAGGLFERLPPRRHTLPSIPLMHFVRYDSLLTYDHARARWRQTGQRRAARRALAALHRSAAVPRRPPGGFRVGPVTPQFSYREYVERVRAIRRHIRAGDIYQADLTMSFTASFDGDSTALYLKLREANPAPYSAFIRCGGVEVLSFSPELLLRFDGRILETHPIKGTIRRRIGRADDAAQHELRMSKKDRAELAMIVDVARNDLARVCRRVEVVGHGRVESFAGLHHTVSTVRGAATGLAPSAILRAAFPGGSITGAPKIRAMQILAELEGERRGVYTGAIGYIGRDGMMALSMAIRTIVIGEGLLRFNSGGGITWDSDPRREYDEMMAKVEVISRALREG